MSARDYLVMMLTSGAEIEHALMVQYLYAAYSINGDQASDEDQAMVEGWRASILSVAREEMGHLLTVQNVLVLLGAPINLRPRDAALGPRILSVSVLARAPVRRGAAVLHLCRDAKARQPGKTRSRQTARKIGGVVDHSGATPGDHKGNHRRAGRAIPQKPCQEGHAPRRRALRRDHQIDLGPREDSGFGFRRHHLRHASLLGRLGARLQAVSPAGRRRRQP